jgi:hypothetical protein
VKGLADQSNRALTLDESRMVASYVRSLSALARDRRKARTKDDLSEKSTKELVELALSFPELRELLEHR